MGRRLHRIAPEAFTSEDQSLGRLLAALPLHAEYSRAPSLHSGGREAVWERVGCDGKDCKFYFRVSPPARSAGVGRSRPLTPAAGMWPWRRK